MQAGFNYVQTLSATIATNTVMRNSVNDQRTEIYHSAYQGSR